MRPVRGRKGLIMGHAAYMRGSAAIRKQGDEDAEKSRLVQVDRYDLFATEEQLTRLRAENARLSRNLRRALVAKRVISLTLEDERQRARAAAEKTGSIRDEFLGKHPSHAYYVAVLADMGVREAIGFALRGRAQ